MQARDDETVLQVALRNGYYIPYFCWHPSLSIHGNCQDLRRAAGRQELGRDRLQHAVAEGMRVLTDSDLVRQHRKDTPAVHHAEPPGRLRDLRQGRRVHAAGLPFRIQRRAVDLDRRQGQVDQYVELSKRIVLDNERCILCTRCVRFTREISKSNALGVKQRGDESLVRASEDGAFEGDAYSDNVVDICPVGAAAVALVPAEGAGVVPQAHASVCPGCARGCTVSVWHRKRNGSCWRRREAERQHRPRHAAREPGRQRTAWICNKGRDLAQISSAHGPSSRCRRASPRPAAATAAARALIAAAKKPVALVSSWGSNEELAAFASAFGSRFTTFVKADHVPLPSEPLEDDLLIRADKNPNTAAARARFGDAAIRFAEGTDLVLVWGEGFDFSLLPRGAKVIF